MGIRQGIQDDVHKDIETHVRRIPQCLYYHACQIVIGHNLVDRIGEEDARIAMRNLRDRSAQRVDGVMRQASHNAFGLAVYLHGTHT